MKYQIIFLGISMLLSGCATVPSTKGELIQASPSSQKYCYSEPLAEVTQRLRSYLSACYRPMTVSGSTFAAGVIIPIQSNIDWSVEEEAIASGTRFTVKGLGKYVLSAQVTGPAPTCSTSSSSRRPARPTSRSPAATGPGTPRRAPVTRAAGSAW